MYGVAKLESYAQWASLHRSSARQPLTAKLIAARIRALSDTTNDHAKIFARLWAKRIGAASLTGSPRPRPNWMAPLEFTRSDIAPNRVGGYRASIS
jgi:hypothetical protein